MKTKDEEDDWEVYSKWFEDNKQMFHDTQFTDKEIGYAAWLAGIRWIAND